MTATLEDPAQAAGQQLEATDNLPAVREHRDNGSRKMQLTDRGIRPENIQELWRIAEAISRSGLAPKNMERPETIFVALEMGLELGMPLMMAMRCIAVINGKPSIYGDSALALVRASGLLEQIEEWFEIDGVKLTTSGGHARTPTTRELQQDGCTAMCLTKRLRSEPKVTTFSIGDAKAADLLGKGGPWKQYPGRMLMFRARGFNLRDNFGDVLQGMHTAEEVGDEPSPFLAAASAAPSVFGRAKSLEDLRANGKTVPHPTAEGQVIDKADSQESDDTLAANAAAKAEQLIEQKAQEVRQAREQQAPQTEATPPAGPKLPDSVNLASYEGFCGAMQAYAQDNGIPEGQLRKALSQINLDHLVKQSPGNRKGDDARKKVWGAVANGQFDWSTYKVLS